MTKIMSATAATLAPVQTPIFPQVRPVTVVLVRFGQAALIAEIARALLRTMRASPGSTAPEHRINPPPASSRNCRNVSKGQISNSTPELSWMVKRRLSTSSETKTCRRCAESPSKYRASTHVNATLECPTDIQCIGETIRINHIIASALVYLLQRLRILDPERVNIMAENRC